MRLQLLRFLLISLLCGSMLDAAPTQVVDESPVELRELEEGVTLVDFGRVAFGNLRLEARANATVTVHFGEAIKDGRVDRHPPGTVRYRAVTVALDGGSASVVAPPRDRRNTQTNHPKNPPAILTPAEWGVVLPFRWVEIDGWPGELLPQQIVRQAAFASTWDDAAAAFESSNPLLNQVWELCRYSIKATTFAGVYVDGDRERIPYEADAYLNQLSHYYTDNDIQMARDTIDHLLEHGTWPSEWAPHMVFMVYADWMHTGDTPWMAGRYEALKSKTLSDRRGEDALIASNRAQMTRTDIVDWPKGERDGYVFTARNTVVNAFHLQAIKRMAELAHALNKTAEAQAFEADFARGRAAFQQVFFDADKGLYRDGIQTDHTSLHANLFPLAFELVPDEARESLSAWLADRGMRCSVYAAQYLMEGLFENGAGEAALALILADNDRSWRHMLESGTTITWEAWDQKYKPNQDWNHAWGAAPANLLPRYILGAEPLTPGWTTTRIRPQLAGLTAAKGKVPTPLGPILIDWTYSDSFTLSLTIPEGMQAQVELPRLGKASRVFRDGVRIRAVPSEGPYQFHVQGPALSTFKIETTK
ncbi:family 78 glycoside hydrolase catalytic domain [Coraliomargarita algicola]|uniref:alpha-L-rhamnosidase n=1 Tax=Coraliomargarita algicola TaxID=3092156 RepID=A0ABZ0RJL2_9BACT|nr:family 78 glycoside hydrolase catalytic domain [Coraliomargarita sp. J2-16]WPJ96257.1 family 78 glycoside hydrolase catalytic domain [Coraliomargarita sp. J2-16]